jgi:hypothetical protein
MIAHTKTTLLSNTWTNEKITLVASQVTKGGNAMGRRTSREQQRMSPEDRRRFDGWLKANVVVGFILFLGMLAMALATTSTTPNSSSVAAGVSKQFAN